MFWMAFFISLAMTVVGELLRPKQSPPNAKASGLDDFDLPTAEEGRGIPVFCGKVKINGPNVVAYGDLESRALTRKVKTGMFSSKRQTYAHQYFLGMQMVLGHGGDEVDIHEIHFGDAMPAHTRTEEGNGVVRFDFDAPEFFGGNEKEGGISGTLRFYRGTDSQPASAYLATLIDDDAPAYQGLAHAVLEKMYLGTSHYIKPVSYIVSRYPNTLGVEGGRHRIGDDANPICFIYEVMTDATWGVGLQGSDFDRGDLRAVAETIYDEGYGVSLIYNGASSAKEVIGDILRHIDGVMFSDPETGLIRIRLARKDYVLEDLPVYGPDDFLEGINFARPSWLDTKNTVKATYVDRAADFTTAVVAQQDLANVTQRGGEVTVEDLDFSGFSEYDPAAKATARALKTLAYPLARVTGQLTRRAWKTKPADVFRLHWPELGIEDVVFRVNSVSYGGVTKNTIGIEAVEDIFAISNVAYTQPPPSGWTDPLGPPRPLAVEALVEMPYGMEPSEGSVVATFGARSGGVDEGYAILSDRSAPFTNFEERGLATAFTPVGQLADAYFATPAAVDAGFQVVNLRGSPDQGETEFALIVSPAGQEWIAYERVSGGLVSPVTRGVFDTPPRDHPMGSYVYFVSSGYGLENEGEAYTEATEVHAKLLPYNPRGQVDADEVEPLELTTTRRGSRPLPPGKVRINGQHPLALQEPIEGPFTIAWAGRNRHHPVLLDQDANGVEPEEGTTYRVRVFNGFSPEPSAEGIGNMPSAKVSITFASQLRIEVTAIRNGLESYAPQVFLVEYVPSGAAENSVVVDSAEYVMDGGGA